MADDDNAAGVADMSDMAELTDEALARNLRLLYNAKNPYCRCGATLIALNTMDAGSQLYEQSVVAEYLTEGAADLPPHIFGVASACFRGAVASGFEGADQAGRSSFGLPIHDHPCLQAIVVTGESGAGKSFTTKKVGQITVRGWTIGW